MVSMMAEQWLPVYISLLTPIATLAVVLVGFLYNNSRFTELSKSVDSRITELSKSVDSRISDLKDLIKAQGERFDANLARVESSLLSKFAELDTRLTRIESRIS
jgi:predicted PurR-regulated permease PerM